MASAFAEVGVSPELIRAVEEQGWTLPTPVQAEAVPLILGGGDVMAGRLCVKRCTPSESRAASCARARTLR